MHLLNLIEVIPQPLQVKASEHWKNRDTSKIKDFETKVAESDWNFSSPYKSSVSFISSQKEKLHKLYGLGVSAEQSGRMKVEVTEDQIPYHKLGPANKILHNGQIYLYECDLEDCGYMQSMVRFRAMADSFFVLVRYYLRVDNVCVRIFDTRIYHEFGSNHLLREFKHLEGSYEEIRANGHSLSSEWMLSETQADEVAPKMPELLKLVEKITF